jgi:RNA polymerase sigma-70 factor (ECF subfamily)
MVIAPEAPLEAAEQAAGDDGTKPHDVAEQNELKTCIRRGLLGIKDRFRIPLVLYYFDDFSVELIADLCQIPVGTVKSRLHKGRALLKQILEKEGFGI